jgi:hypothetical protein
MSTAAPAAGAAAPVADAAATASATPAPPAGEQTATAQPARTIKPIPPSRPRLPGVLEDGPEDASTPEARAERARDARGRFTSDGTPIVEKGARSTETPPPPAEGEPKIPDLPGEKPKFKVDGREFESIEALEHYVKSINGRYEPVQRKLGQTEGQLVRAAESARGWYAEAQRLQAEIAALKAGGGNPTPAAGETSAPEAAAQGIDWALYADIARIANEAGEPWKAQQWLQEQVDALRARDAQALREEIARLRDEAIEGPRREAAEQAELASTADTIVNSLVAQRNPDGSPTFPEMADGEQARAVGELWSSLGLDPRMALTPGGAVAAVALYRLARSMDGALAAPQPTSNPVPAVPAPPNPAAAAAAGLEGGRPLLPAATERRELDPSTARLIAGLKSKELLRPGLGFSA